MKIFQRFGIVKTLVLLCVSGMVGVIPVTMADTYVRPPVKHNLVTGIIDQIDSRNNVLYINDHGFNIAPTVEVKRANGEIVSARYLRAKMKVRLEVEYTLTNKGNYTSQVTRITLQ